jgi:hypothetical protein
VSRYVWAKRGREVLVLTTGSHKRTCLFGALSIDGRQLFRQRDNIDGENFLAYLEELKRKFAPMLLFLDISNPHYTHVTGGLDLRPPLAEGVIMIYLALDRG